MLERWTALDRGLRGIEAACVAGVLGIAARLPVERASDLGGWIGRSFGPRLRKSANVRANLAVAFPDRDPAWIDRTTGDVWAQIGRTLAEYPHIPTLAGPALRERVELVSHVPPAELRGPHGLVFVAAHQANWELLAVAGALADFPLSVVYAEQKNAAVGRLIQRYRGALPCGLITVRDTVRRMMTEIAHGRSVGLLIDQRIDEGEPVPFMGFPAPTSTIAARIAAKLDTAVVPTRLERLPGVRFRLTLGRPIRRDPAHRDPRHAAFAMTERVNAAFARWILERPADWCCVKRRWPKEVMESAKEAMAFPGTEGAVVPAK